MLRFIGNFFGGSWTRIKLTAEQIRWTLFIISALTVIGIFPAFCGASIVFSACFAFPFWAFSGYRILSVQRYLNFAIAGEIADTFSAIGPEENETIWDSKMAATYRKVAINVWLFQTLIFLAAPLYFNFTSGGRWWLPILIMLFTAITLASIKAGLWIFRIATVVVIISLLAISTYDIFPQLGAIPIIGNAAVQARTGRIYGENIRKTVDINTLREKQRQEMVSVAQEKARKWQEVNKGKEIPEGIRIEIDAAKEGKTPSEYKKEVRDEINKHLQVQVPSEKAAETKESKIVRNIINGQNVWSGSYYPDQKPGPVSVCGLKAGKYELTIMNDDVDSLRGSINGGEDFVVRNGQILPISEKACLSFSAEKGGMIGISFKRIG